MGTKMQTRSARPEDIVHLLNIPTTYPMPDLSQSALTQVVHEGGKVIGLGTLVRTIEAVLVLDAALPQLTRARAAAQLMEAGIFESQRLGYKDMHVFLAGDVDSRFEGLLKRRFGFVDCKGEPLTLIL